MAQPDAAPLIGIQTLSSKDRVALGRLFLVPRKTTSDLLCRGQSRGFHPNSEMQSPQHREEGGDGCVLAGLKPVNDFPNLSRSLGDFHLRQPQLSTTVAQLLSQLVWKPRIASHGWQ